MDRYIFISKKFTRNYLNSFNYILNFGKLKYNDQ